MVVASTADRQLAARRCALSRERPVPLVVWTAAGPGLLMCHAPVPFRYQSQRPLSMPSRYKYRLVVDESVALGVLGATGRGAAQAAGLSTKDVDIVAASLSAPPRRAWS